MYFWIVLEITPYLQHCLDKNGSEKKKKSVVLIWSEKRSSYWAHPRTVSGQTQTIDSQCRVGFFDLPSSDLSHGLDGVQPAVLC